LRLKSQDSRGLAIVATSSAGPHGDGADTMPHDQAGVSLDGIDDFSIDKPRPVPRFIASDVRVPTTCSIARTWARAGP
jgi:hypothetical protein